MLDLLSGLRRLSMPDLLSEVTAMVATLLPGPDLRSLLERLSGLDRLSVPDPLLLTRDSDTISSPFLDRGILL